MIVLTINIGVYFISEDYRFFLKKIKYQDEIVYEEREIPSEASLNNSLGYEDNINPVVEEEWSWEWDIEDDQEYTFLDILSWSAVLSNQEEILPDLTWSEEQFVENFSSFDVELLDYNSSLFDITTEFPDLYYEYYSEDLTVYVFPSKTYEETRKILEVLSFELPYTLNEVDNFWQSSLYVNIDNAYRDDLVRIVLKHKNKAFWLKIQKDNYNTVKEILENLQN